MFCTYCEKIFGNLLKIACLPSISACVMVCANVSTEISHKQDCAIGAKDKCQGSIATPPRSLSYG